MEKTLISFDYAIKDVLREKANFDVLSGLLSELLKKDVVVQELLESESNPNGEIGKSNRLDLKAKINDGEIAIFEIQSSTESDFFHRILWGTSKTIVEQLSKGDNFGGIKKVYSIDIVYFELGKGNDYIYHGFTEFKGLHNAETLLLSAKEIKYLPSCQDEIKKVNASEIFPEYYLIYPNRFDENIKDKFDEWVYFFKNSKVKVDFSAKGIQEASEKLAIEKMTAAEKNDYEVFVKSERIKSNEIETAKFEGKAEIAKNLVNLGMPIEQIAQATGLSVGQIGAL